MFRASSSHLQEDTLVHMQHMLLSLCKQTQHVIFYINLMYSQTPRLNLPYTLTHMKYFRL